MKPLEGIRVLEVAAYISGPLAGKLLADLGARVIKLEPPTGDPARRWVQAPGSDSSRSSPWFCAFNLAKLSVVLPAAAEQRRRYLHALIRNADVVITNLPRDTQASWGVDARQIHALNERVIHLQILGDNTSEQAGPAFDSVAQAAMGLMSTEHGIPEVIPFPICDTSAALVAVCQILACLLARERGERRIAQSVSLTEASLLHRIEALTLFANLGLTPSPSQRSKLAQIYTLPTSDARWVLVHLSGSQRAWESFCSALGLPGQWHSLDRGQRILRHPAILKVAKNQALALPAEELMARLASARVPHSLVRTEDELFLLAQSGRLRGIQTSGDTVSATFPSVDDPPRAAPELGEHTEQVLREILDFQSDYSIDAQ